MMVKLSRRTALVRLLLGVAVAPLGLQSLAQSGRASAFAQEVSPPADLPLDQPPATPRVSGLVESNHHYFTLAGPGGDGPLDANATRNPYGAEIGYSVFDSGTFMIHHNADQSLLSSEWLNRRIGNFSIKNGALMVTARGELNDVGCWGLEMRRQAYHDRRYIRADWLMLDPPTGMVSLETNGMYQNMQMIAEVSSVAAVRPLGEWNTMLFLASGSHVEGWINGVKAVEGDEAHFSSGQIALVAERMGRTPLRILYRDLHVWDDVLPDPTSVWG